MNSSIIILFLASIASSVPVGGQGLPIAAKELAVELNPEGQLLKGLLDKWDARAAKSPLSRDDQLNALSKKLNPLTHKEEKALTQKLLNPSNFAGENGKADFAKDFHNLMKHLKSEKMKNENMH
jgi:hypothetical protein